MAVWAAAKPLATSARVMAKTGKGMAKRAKGVTKAAVGVRRDRAARRPPVSRRASVMPADPLPRGIEAEGRERRGPVDRPVRPAAGRPGHEGPQIDQQQVVAAVVVVWSPRRAPGNRRVRKGPGHRAPTRRTRLLRWLVGRWPSLGPCAIPSVACGVPAGTPGSAGSMAQRRRGRPLGSGGAASSCWWRPVCCCCAPWRRRCR